MRNREKAKNKFYVSDKHIKDEVKDKLYWFEYIYDSEELPLY